MKIILQERKSGFFAVFIQNEKGGWWLEGSYSKINKHEAKAHAINLAAFLGIQLIEVKED